MAFGFHTFHFQIRHRCFQHRVPVHQSLATVNQALFKQPNKHFSNRFGQGGVHGEVLALPIHTRTHAAHLLGNFAAALVFPFPNFFHEFFATQIVAGSVLGGQLAFNHNLSGNACVVCARLPQGVVATHAVITR